MFTFDPVNVHDPQCVHYDYEQLSEGYTYDRCGNFVDVFVTSPRHGWLCQEHMFLTEPRHPELRKNTDQEQIDFIIGQDRKAIEAGTLKRVEMIDPLYITYLESREN